MSLLATLLGRWRDPTKDWPAGQSSLPVYYLADGRFGQLRLTDEVDQARPLGRPDRVQWGGFNDFRLTYDRQGLELNFGRRRLDSLIFYFRKEAQEWADKPPTGLATLTLQTGQRAVQLSGETHDDEIRQSLGEPDADVTDDEEIMLTYDPGSRQTLDFEFTLDGRLKLLEIGNNEQFPDP